MRKELPKIEWSGRWTTFDNQTKDKLPKEMSGDISELVEFIKPHGKGKDGRKITFACYKEKINRKTENIRYLGGFVFDWDYATADDLHHIESAFPFFYIIYSSFSDTLELRKFRILIPIKQQIDPFSYKVLYQVLVSQLHKDCSAPDENSEGPHMIWNTQREDAKNNWILYSEFDNILDTEDLPGGESSLKEFVRLERQKQDEEEAERKRKAEEMWKRIDGEPDRDAQVHYANQALRSACDTISHLPKGDRNRRLFSECASIGELVGSGLLLYDQTKEILIESGSASGHDRKAVMATVQSALKRGMQNPREPAIAKSTEKIKPLPSTQGTKAKDKKPEEKSRFVVTKSGLFYIKNMGQKDEEYVWICSSLKVTAVTRDDVSQNWGRLLEFTDRDGNKKEWAMPMEYTATEGAEYRRILLNMGLEIATSKFAKEKLTQYIITAKPDQSGICTTKVGWYKNVYVLPDKVIGKRKERVIFQSPSISNLYESKGSVDDWKNNVSSLCVGNSRLILSICAGFAAPLLSVIQADSGGFHFKGSSSTGKSTALRAASSLFGSPRFIRQWRATDNGLEAIACQQNDSLLILDEIGQVDPKAVGNISYMLANGCSKARAVKYGGTTRDILYWKLIFLSSGELGLGEHMDRSGQRSQAGMEVRLLEIPADAGAGRGIFENLHGMKDGSRFADTLKLRCSKFYGTVHEAWLNKLVEKYDDLFELIHASKADLIKEFSRPDYSGQVLRALDRFALLAVAGELATEWGLTGWEPLEATKSIVRCFEDWLVERGGFADAEEMKHLEQIRRYFQMNHSSKFLSQREMSNLGDTRIYEQAGWFKKTKEGLRFYCFPEVFNHEICKGLSSKSVCQTLVKHGILIPDPKGKYSIPTKPPGRNKTIRAYCLTDAAIGESTNQVELAV